MSKTRRKFSKEFKAKVVLESLKERETIESLAKKYDLQPTQISMWKSLALKNFSNVFSSENDEEKKNEDDIQNLYAQIGQQKVEIDFFKKKVEMKSTSDRQLMIEKCHPKLSIANQCTLLSIHRSGLYYKPVAESSFNLEILRILDEQYFETPFYGVLRLTKMLQKRGYSVNEKRVRRLMKLVNWQTIYTEPKTTKVNKADYKYPYLLRDIKITEKNQVWAMDITYIPMKKGFMYLTAIIDLYSRYVVNRSLSNTMSAEWCSEVLEEALAKNGKPQIFNTDQGSQFTSEIFINTLKKTKYKYQWTEKVEP